MIGPRKSRRAVALLIALAALAAGCETGFIQESAASSFASFLTDVFSTAVNEALVGS